MSVPETMDSITPEAAPTEQPQDQTPPSAGFLLCKVL